MDDELINRIRRIYAAIGATEEADFHKLQATVVRTKKVIGLYQDFHGGLSKEELSNLAHSMIHNIASLPNHLEKWAANNKKDRNKVKDAVNHSPVLLVMIDLSNNDKHGYPPRKGGRSGKSPKLVNINRVLQLRTKPEKGSTIRVSLDPDGTLKKSGNGSAKAIITGEIINKNGDKIGELNQIAKSAVEALEQLLSEFNTTPKSTNGG